MSRGNVASTKQYYIDWMNTPTYTDVIPWYSVISPDGSDKPHPDDQASIRVMPSDEESKDVLVVEDESYLCELIADVLESEGHIARKASNGKEAMELIRERPPQLILLDLMMPIMDGWEFMQALRADPDWDGIPVVLITAVYDVKRTQLQTGAKAVLTKPFDIEEVVQMVRIYAK